MLNARRLISTLVIGTALSTTLAQAAPYPEKPITAIVPFLPGGSTDMIARTIGAKFQAKLGQPMIVENKPGATGAIGAGFVKTAPADGYTILVASIGVYSVNPHLQKKLAYDPSKDFDLLTVAVRAPNVLVVNHNLPASTVAEFVAYLKKNPQKVSFGTSGAGSSDHLTTALFWQKTSTNGVHIPYKGGAAVLSDVMAGHAEASFQNLNVVIPHVKSGKLKALAITSDKRSPLLPGVPTMNEAGIKDLEVTSWQAVAAPRGLAPDVKTKLHEAIVSILNEPDIKQRLTDQGFDVVASSSDDFKKFQAAELERWKKVIQDGNITID